MADDRIRALGYELVYLTTRYIERRPRPADDADNNGDDSDPLDHLVGAVGSPQSGIAEREHENADSGCGGKHELADDLHIRNRHWTGNGHEISLPLRPRPTKPGN